MKAKRMNIISAVLAVGLVCISSVQNANAYFTTYVTAKGGYEVSWKHREHIEETFQDRKKYVTITSEEGSVPVYVRVKAFAGTTYKLSYDGKKDGKDMWESGPDGYWYYTSTLSGGGATDKLVVSIDNIPNNPKDGANFNVVVVYETVPVQYDADGKLIDAKYANWTQSKTSQTTHGE